MSIERRGPSASLAAWLTLSLAVSLGAWIPFLIGNRLAGHPLDAAALFGYLALFHGALLAAALGAARGALALAARVGLAVPRGAARGWTWGTGLGTLVAVNAVLTFPVVYGPFNTREQPFATPLGLWSLPVFLAAPFALGLGLSAKTWCRRRFFGVVWAGLFVLTVAAHLVAQRPPAVDLGTAETLREAEPWTGGTPATPEGRGVVLLGFDGLSWNLLLPLLERGELPELRRLLRRGARGALATDVPTLSPAIWTTLATGRRPADHGIFTFSKFLLPGMKTPLRYGPYLSTPNWWCGLNRFLLQARYRGWVGNRTYYSTDRRVPSLWDVADHHGLTTGMVGWYAAWPVAAARSGGFRVSDFGPRSGSLFPEEEIRPWIGLSRPVEDLLRPPAGEPFVAQIWQETYDAVLRTRELLRRYEPRFAAAYFRFPDPLLHHAWRGDRFLLLDAAPDVDRVPVEVVASYRFFDLLLGALMEVIGPDRLVFLVSDHGFQFDGRQHHHAPPGVLVASGPGVRRGAVIEGASIYDIFPTITTLLRLPVTARAPGRVVAEIFQPGVLEAARTVAAYDWYRPREGRSGKPMQELEEKELRRLRALGYVN